MNLNVQQTPSVDNQSLHSRSAFGCRVNLRGIKRSLLIAGNIRRRSFPYAGRVSGTHPCAHSSTGFTAQHRCLLLPGSPSCVIFCKKKKKILSVQRFFPTGASECSRGFGAKISQSLISIQPHLLLCLVVIWLVMCD